MAHQLCERRPQAIQTSSERYAQVVHKFNKKSSETVPATDQELIINRSEVIQRSSKSYAYVAQQLLRRSFTLHWNVVQQLCPNRPLYAKVFKKFPNIVLTLCTNRPGLF